jgi:hypothetical protein
LLTAWHRLQTQQQRFLQQQEIQLERTPALSGLLRRMSMKTTASVTNDGLDALGLKVSEAGCTPSASNAAGHLSSRRGAYFG